MSENTLSAKLPPYEPKYEDTASLEHCRCREPVPNRRYLEVWVCARCSKPIAGRDAE